MKNAGVDDNDTFLCPVESMTWYATYVNCYSVAYDKKWLYIVYTCIRKYKQSVTVRKERTTHGFSCCEHQINISQAMLIYVCLWKIWDL